MFFCSSRVGFLGLAGIGLISTASIAIWPWDLAQLHKHSVVHHPLYYCFLLFCVVSSKLSLSQPTGFTIHSWNLTKILLDVETGWIIMWLLIKDSKYKSSKITDTSFMENYQTLWLQIRGETGRQTW